jgi:hypothetical protein
MSISGLARDFSTLFAVLAVFGLLFVLIIAVAKRLRGATGVWIAWGVYVTAVTISCIYKLSGLSTGSSLSFALALYYVAVALGSVGVPLWCAARSFLWLSEKRPELREPFRLAASWGVSLAAAPLGLFMIVLVDTIVGAG